MHTKDDIRVLMIFSQPWHIGGAESHLLALVQEFRTLGIHTAIVGLDDTIKEVFQGVPVTVLPLRTHSLSPFIDNIKKLKGIIDEEKINILHCHQRTAMVYARILKFQSSIPYTLTLHDRWRPLHNLYRPLIPKPCIAISEGIKAHAVQKLGLQGEGIHVILNGISFDCPDGMIQPSKHSIIYVSRLNRLKGEVALLLCEAAALLRQSIPSVTLTIVGDGPYLAHVSKQAEAVNRSCQQPIITVLGARNDVPDLLAGHSVAVGVGRVALEAMAAQRPVVAIADPENFPGLITAENWQSASTTSWTRGEKEVTVANIAKELELVLVNPVLAKEVGLFGQELVRTECSARAMALKTISHYQTVLASSQKK